MSGACHICEHLPEVAKGIIDRSLADGTGYRRTYQILRNQGLGYTREAVREHMAHVERPDAGVMSSIAAAEDGAQAEVAEVTEFFARHGLELPPEGTRWKAATVTMTNESGEKSWVRIVPVDAESERLEIRQATPVNVSFYSPTVFVRGKWNTWVCTPDAQIGYWVDSNDQWHTIHDERAFSVGHQIAQEISEAGELYGWMDCGDLTDLAAPSRHDPTVIDTRVACLNRTFERGALEMARRRALVGPDGEVVVVSGNHDIRLRTKASEQQPYLVGLRMPGDEDQFPVLSVPFLMRFKDFGVEWAPSWPTGYRRFNSNLVACHSLGYGSKPFDTARKIASKIHASAVYGHTHRREALAENIETDKGTRTLEIWSDGTWARTDGSLPGSENMTDEFGNRMLVPDPGTDSKWGMIGPNAHQGLSVVHVENGGRERFSVERIAIWDGFAMWRGEEYYAECDKDGHTSVDVSAA